MKHKSIVVKQMKIYYGSVNSGCLPMIKISNSLLKVFNFKVGDEIEVIYEQNKITITKIGLITK